MFYWDGVSVGEWLFRGRVFLGVVERFDYWDCLFLGKELKCLTG